MGMMENLRNIFGISKSEPKTNNNLNSQNKSILITQILNSIDKIKRINSFDSSIRNIANISSYELQRKSIEELESLNANLTSKLQSLSQQSQKRNPQADSLEASKWTGEKPSHLTSHEFDRFQRDESR